MRINNFKNIRTLEHKVSAETCEKAMTDARSLD